MSTVQNSGLLRSYEAVLGTFGVDIEDVEEQLTGKKCWRLGVNRPTPV